MNAFLPFAGGAVALALLWLVLSMVRAVLEEEAVGQVKRLARALIRRAARRLPEEERDVFIRDLLAELESPELSDRPLSQLFTALDVWIHAADLRPVPRRALRRAGRSTMSLLLWLGGKDPQTATLIPGERQFGVLLGGAVLNVGLLAGGAATLVTHDWLFASMPVAVGCGCCTGALAIFSEHLCLTLRPALNFDYWVATAVGLLMQILMGLMIAMALRLTLLRQEILFQAEVAHPGSGPSLGLWEGILNLERMTSRRSSIVLSNLGLSLLMVSQVILPTVVSLLHRLTRRRSGASVS